MIKQLETETLKMINQSNSGSTQANDDADLKRKKELQAEYERLQKVLQDKTDQVEELRNRQQSPPRSGSTSDDTKLKCGNCNNKVGLWKIFSVFLLFVSFFSPFFLLFFSFFSPFCSFFSPFFFIFFPFFSVFFSFFFSIFCIFYFSLFFSQKEKSCTNNNIFYSVLSGKSMCCLYLWALCMQQLRKSSNKRSKSMSWCKLQPRINKEFDNSTKSGKTKPWRWIRRIRWWLLSYNL